MEQNSQNDVTSISNLPSSTQVLNNIEVPSQNPAGNMPNNIILTKNEVVGELNTQLQNPVIHQAATQQPEKNQQESQNNYNEMISQLQKATASGATGLPTRDIPIDPTMVNSDVQIKPNFIPPPNVNEDYINNMETPGNLIEQNNRKQANVDNLDAFYSEFQLPLLISILYFMFQLPIFRRNLKKMFPALFGNDGNPNFYGYLFNSVLFSSLFYLLLKLINQVTINVSQ